MPRVTSVRRHRWYLSTAMAMQPRDLHDPGRFAVVDELDHRRLVPAITSYLGRATPVRAAYVAANILAIALIGWLLLHTRVPLFDALSRVALGLVGGYLALVPAHEGLHAAAYRFYGAPHVRTVYRWRTLSAFCAADRFVVTGRQFAWICATPFVVINAALVLPVALGGPWQLPAAGALLLHIGACSGDVALLGYLWTHRRVDLLTYDDLAAQRSYFFRPVS